MNGRTNASSGGGKYKEKLLWTNESPTDSFDSQSIDIGSFNDYDKIAIKYKHNIYGSGQEYERTYIVGIPESMADDICGAITETYSLGSTAPLYRRIIIFKVSSGEGQHSISIASCYPESNNISDNTYIIPLEIYGLVER